ncbi:MAG: MFS transporter [Ktedonobacteraceae bacterium]
MKETVVPTSRAANTDVHAQSERASTPTHQRIRSIFYGVVAAILLTLLIIIGSRGFHWFDAALIGYAVATIFAAAAVTYKYTFWLARPPTGRYWWRSWQLFFSYENFRSYTLLIPRAILDLFSQQFIRRRGWYRWITHQCIFWGVLLSCAITFPLTFGWLRFTQTPTTLYQIWFFGFPLLALPLDSPFAFVIIHALDFTSAILFVGLVMAFHRRFHDLALISVQRWGFDIVPLALLMAIVVTGVALTADSAFLGGAYYWFISLSHEAVVVLWLISLPFGKFFHIIERPATVGIELYWRTGEGTVMQRCARCDEEFAPVRFIQDLKKTLYDVDENYTLRDVAAVQESVPTDGHAKASQATSIASTQMLWWQDICPTCKRVMRAQANLAALGREGNQFL